MKTPKVDLVGSVPTLARHRYPPLVLRKHTETEVIGNGRIGAATLDLYLPLSCAAVQDGL